MASKRKRSFNGESESLSLLKEDEGPSFARLDAPFPRGGGAAATPLDIKRASAEATRDVYNQMTKESKPKSKKTRKSASASTQTSEFDKPRIEPLLFNRIKPGTLLLGQVTEIKNFELVLSLPSNLVGFVEFEEDEEDQPDPATLYHVGQWLRAVVTGLGEAPRKRIELSISSELVNQTIDEDDILLAGMPVQALVKSIEDHGAILSLGDSSEYSAFLPNKNQHEPVKAGQMVLASVSKVKNKLITLSTKSHTPLATIHQQPALVPGSLVEVLISEVLSSGCICSVFGHINVSADLIHSQIHIDTPEVGEKVRARIIFSHPSDNIGEPHRIIGLSLIPNIVELAKSAESTAFLPGQILEAARVIAVDNTVGLFLDIGLDRPAFAHISRLSDDRIEDLSVESRYKIGTVHKARIISYSQVDNLYQLSLEPKILNQRFLRLDQVPVGEIITDAKVERILPKGAVIISLGDGINGLASEFHLSDIKLSQPERKFKPGQTVTVRVLAVDKAHHRIKLTAKKSLINSETPLFADLNDIKVGDKSTGTVVAFRNNGAIIEFGGDVKGFLPLAEMSEATITNPKDHFRLGQSVSVHVLDVDASRNRLVVSCRTHSTGGVQSSPGEIVDASITEKTKDSLILELESGEKAVLPFTHLVDDSTKAKAEQKKHKVGSKLKVVVLVPSSRGTLVSYKPSLIEAAESGTLPLSFEDLEPRKKYAGFVSAASDDVGIFVSFGNKLVGLVPKTEVQSNVFTVGQSVSPRVLKLDRENERFLLTFADADTNEDEVLDVTPGTVVTAVIKAVKETQLNVQIGKRQGRIDVSQLFDDASEIDDVRKPLAQFSKDQKIRAKIIGFHDARTHMFLPISNRNASHVVLELSAKSSVVDGKAEPVTLESFERGSKCLAFINNITEDAVWANVAPSIRSKISRLDLSADPEVLADMDENFNIGQALECTVISNSPQLVLTCLENQDSGLAVVHRVTPTRLFVRLSGFRNGVISATESGDKFESLEDKFEEGTVLRSQQIVTDDDGKIWVSLRTTPGIQSASEVSEGDIVEGYIKNISDAGVFVELSRTVVGRVQISQLSDLYLKEWKKHFKAGQIVKGKIVSKKGSRIELSLKESVVSGKKAAQPGLDTLEIGSIMEGTVRKVQDYGVFVTLADTGLSGLCHRSEVADRPITNLTSIFSEGDKVKVKVLAVDLEKRKVSLGMKASYFGDDDDEEDIEMSDVVDESDEEEDQDIRDIDDDSEIELGSDSDDNDEDSNDDSDEDDAAGDGLSAGFDWTGEILNKDSGSEDDSDSSSDEDAPRRKRKKVEFVEDQTAQLNSRLPQSAKDFERLLVSEPNSSVLWMNYMAFQLQLSEIDAARDIARRALKTIAIREEDEKFNVWIALLNLENSFGTPETVQEVFREACQYMDSRLVHLKMASIYASSEDKLEEAKRVYNAACKRFGSEDLQVWCESIGFLFANGFAEEARSALERALRQLPKRDHKDVSLQVAKHEYLEGDAERGRTLFEGLVTSYPKKVDLWSVYLDQEVKHDPANRKLIEALYERVFERKLSMKQAKFFFKKWLSYEVEHGDQRGADYVKAKAAQFVEQGK